MAENGARRRADDVRSAVVIKPWEFVEHPNKEELRSKRCDGEVEALDPETGNPKNETPSKIKSERWARSSGFAGDFPRNPHSVRAAGPNRAIRPRFFSLTKRARTSLPTETDQ